METVGDQVRQQDSGDGRAGQVARVQYCKFARVGCGVVNVAEQPAVILGFASGAGDERRLGTAEARSEVVFGCHIGYDVVLVHRTGHEVFTDADGMPEAVCSPGQITSHNRELVETIVDSLLGDDARPRVQRPPVQRWQRVVGRTQDIAVEK